MASSFSSAGGSEETESTDAFAVVRNYNITTNTYAVCVYENQLFSGGEDTTIKVWNVATGVCKNCRTETSTPSL